MMKEPTTPNAARLHDLICANRLSDAIQQMRQCLPRHSELADLTDKVEQLDDDYRLTLNFLASGAEDPQRANVLAQLRQRAHDLADIIEARLWAAQPTASRRKVSLGLQEINRADLTRLVAEYKQNSLLQAGGLTAAEPLADALDRQRLEETEVELVFEHVVNDANIPEPSRAFIMGALAHNVINRHNRHALSALMASAMQDDVGETVLARICVTLVASMLTSPSRWEEDARLAGELRALTTERDDLARQMRLATCQIAKTHLVKKIESFIVNDMAQEIGKLAKRIIDQKGKSDLHEITAEDIAQIFGPDKQTVVGKFSQIAQWQADGADVNYSTHHHLKTSPFFSSEINWLRPFDPADPAVADALKALGPEERESLAQSIAAMPICDSDKYSTLTVLGGMPAQNAVALQKNFDTEARHWAEMQAERQQATPDEMRLRNLTDNFIKDLYRAFRIRPDRFGDTDLFDEAAWPLDSAPLDILFPTAEDKDALGRELVRYDCWAAASRLYAHACATTEPSADLTRKYALCLEKAGEADRAIEQLKKAELMDDANVWTKHTLAQCYYDRAEYKTALFYLNEAATLKQPTVAKRLMAAKCLASLGQYQQARNAYMGLTFDAPDEADGYLGTAICDIALGKREEAQKYVDMAHENCQDINSRHDAEATALLLLARRNFGAAATSLAALAKETGEAAVLDFIDAHRATLTQYGVGPAEADLFTELLRMEVRK